MTKFLSILSIVLSILAIIISLSAIGSNNTVEQSYGVAYFKPSDEGFQTIDAEGLGSILISIEKIEKYADGYKVKFQIGNPTSMTLNNANFRIEWGKDFELTKIVHIKKNLLPGHWSNIETTIGPANEEQIGIFAITNFTAENVILRQ